MTQIVAKQPHSQPLTNTSTSHFWVSSFPFFSSTLFLVSPCAATEPAQNKVFLFDSDGALVSDLSLIFPAERVCVLDLDQIMSSCKMDSGLKHGHLHLESVAGVKHFIKVHNGKNGALLSPPGQISLKRGGFFPVIFGEGRSSLVCLANCGGIEAKVKVRLFLGNRTPEMTCSVPPHGSRVVCVDETFAEYIPNNPDRQVPGYLRLTALSDEAISVSLLERSLGAGGIENLSMVG